MFVHPIKFSDDLHMQLAKLQARLKEETGEVYELSAVVCRMTRLGLDEVSQYTMVRRVFGRPEQAAEKTSAEVAAKKTPRKAQKAKPTPQRWPSAKSA